MTPPRLPNRADMIARLRKAVAFLLTQPEAAAFSVQAQSLHATALLMEFRPDFVPPDLDAQLYAADGIEDYVAAVRQSGVLNDRPRPSVDPAGHHPDS